MALDESKIVSSLTKNLRENLPPSFVVQRHEHHAGVAVGWPDLEVCGNHATTHLEVKLADPAIRTRGIQELTMKRLALADRAFYVIYYERVPEQRSTHIITVEQFATNTWMNVEFQILRWGEIKCRMSGFNHRLVENFIRSTHL